MTEHGSTSGGRGDEDDALRALLRTADPAHDLPPRDPHWITWKVEDTMTHDQLTPHTPAPTTPARRRRTGLLAGLAGAAAAAVAAGALALGTGTAATTSLTAAGADGPMASCAVITAESLAQRQVAFEGRVTGVDDGVVTLEVVHRYRGVVEDRVTVAQPADQLLEFGPVPFVEGQDYLVSADDGRLSGCGQTGTASPELRALYDQAFPG